LFVVEIDNYFNKFEHIANTFIIIYSFVLKIVFKILLKYCYKYNIVLLNKIDILLKFYYIVYCKDLLNQVLNYSFCNLFFVQYFENLLKLFLKVVKVYKYCTRIFVIIFQIFA